MTAPPVQPAEILITAVQFTPDRAPVLIQYGTKDATGPLGRGLHHTTQAVLEGRSGTAGAWGDAECKAELAEHLAAHGIAAVIVDNAEPVAVPDAAPNATTEAPAV